MNTTVIAHFYNEEYLLPWWLKHHQKLFENGILIDYNSTDRSVEIINDLAPNWKVVNSKNTMFGAADADKEVMEYEASIEGYKMSLNITEFFFPYCSIEHLDREIEEIVKNVNNIPTQYHSGVRTYGVMMIDNDPSVIPSYNDSLIKQKHHGAISGYDAFDDGMKALQPDYFKIYGRFIHKEVNGNYHAGRHYSGNNFQNKFDIFTLKYKFAPWNETTIKRMQQFKDKIPSGDLATNAGSQHTQSEEEYLNRYKHAFQYVSDLTLDKNFSRCYDYCMSL